MIAVYAMGGGLGHLARTRRVLAALEPEGTQATVITASPLAGTMPLGANTEVIIAPRDRLAFPRWLKGTLRSLAPDTVVVDAFPLGVFGELADHSVLPEARLFHVARLLRWNAYRGAFAGTPRRYDATFAVEALTPAHASFIERNSARVLSLALTAPEAPPLQAGAPWLISHAGPQSEVNALHAFARREAARRGERPRFAFRTPRSPALRAFSSLVTACGFNSMLEGGAYGERHFFLPLARRFDNQALRAARRRRELRA